MNAAVVDKIVQAVLYEGYNLYPYRPSVKNRCRWTFGGLYPQSYSEASKGSDAWNLQLQCLAQAVGKCVLEFRLRFLHLTQRTIGVLPAPCDKLPMDKDPIYETVEAFTLNGTRHQSWQEAVEREVTVGPIAIDSLLAGPQVKSFTVAGGHTLEPLHGRDGQIVAVIVRDRETLEGSAEVLIERREEDESVFRLTVRVFNHTPLDDAPSRSRDEALMRTLVAMHVVVSVQEGKFFSLTDPPKTLRTATAECHNLGVWPVLVGEPGEQNAMLASPIILYDYPQIAPESPGDLFDATEIDEILSLRIMTLTDEEKAAAAATDDRTRRLIERTESLAREQLAGLHGAVRQFQPVASAAGPVAWDPFAPQGASDALPIDGAGMPTISSIRVDGVDVRPGDRVRLMPGLGGDIFDLALAGKTATIESIEQDFEDHYHVAVTVDDDPGQDFGRARQPGHRFFFKPDEIVPLERAGGRT